MLRPGVLLAGLIAGPVMAGEVVVSPQPGAVSVTVSRAPARGAGEAMALGWLGGYALISETREVNLPKGEAVVRFEGVAEGMLPESAIVSGLPQGVVEKNLDADLLSPRSLYGRAFGRPVILRRADAVGHVREEAAIIRSAPDGAAVLQTKAGFEIANCGGLADALVYDGLPDGSPARPSLSVATVSPVAGKVRLTLSYLAWGFDWQAHYVLRMMPGAQAAQMTAWVTLASSDGTSFAGAQAAVVGGKVHFDEARAGKAEAPPLEMTCRLAQPVPVKDEMMPIVAPPAPMMMMAAPAIATVRKAIAPVVVRPEALGDLKLYKVPMPTTIAAHAQKQVALMDGRRVKIAVVYTADISGEADGAAGMSLRLNNRKADGLGLALPAGGVMVEQEMGVGAVPFGRGALEDKAVGEEVKVELAPSSQVTWEARIRGMAGGVQVVVRNANRWPVRFEARLPVAEGERVLGASVRLGRKDGVDMWRVLVPAQGQMRLRYRVARAR